MNNPIIEKFREVLRDRHANYHELNDIRIEVARELLFEYDRLRGEVSSLQALVVKADLEKEEVKSQLSKGWVCPSCKTDRLKEACMMEN
jgi:uncharacterized protein (DUF39 family)